jgi:branched-chain amino acid aminotransferase
LLKSEFLHFERNFCLFFMVSSTSTVSSTTGIGVASAQQNYIWQDQRLHEASALTLSPLDHGFTVGNGTFETLMAMNGVAFALTRHWRRLCEGCASLNIAPPALELVAEAFEQVLKANSLRNARLRFTVSSGVGPAGAVQTGVAPTYVASATQLTQPTTSESLVILPWSRNEHGALTGIKSTSYAENVRALHFARARGAGEALFLNTRQELCEGTGSNVFVNIEGQIYTPPLSSGCLAGVTRELILEEAQKVGVSILETPLNRDDLMNADEVFITSTLRGVQPITTIDGMPLPAAPGPATLNLRRLYRDLQERSMDP